MTPASEEINTMNESIGRLDQRTEDILSFKVSDDALEAAARPPASMAMMSFVGAPTVSVLVACCSNSKPAVRE